MIVRATLSHTSRYTYDRDVVFGPHTLRLRPAARPHRIIRNYSLRITPEPQSLHWQHDALGNWQARALFKEPARSLIVETRFETESESHNPFDFLVAPEAMLLPFAYTPETARALAPFLALEKPGPRLRDFVGSLPHEDRETVAHLVDLTRRIHGEFGYLRREEAHTQDPEETLRAGIGACRDLAWLMTETLRAKGLAARYVSGYSIAPDEARHDEAELHAWCEVYLPGAGWIGLDPTAGVLASGGHVPLAATAHYAEAAPIEGTAEQQARAASFSVLVSGLRDESALEMAPEAWASLNALGERIDADLAAQQVRLTMGGEPTFVAMDDPDTAEWRLAALGPTKEAYADALLRKLRARFAPHGLMLHGRGKHYPGEAAPRWAYSLFWRADGLPIWRDAARIAEPDAEDARAEDAERLAKAIARALGVSEAYVLPAFEAPESWLQREAELPHNVLPGDPRLADSDFRASVIRKLALGLEKPCGFVLPLRRARDDAEPAPWRSEKWALRRGALVLPSWEGPLGARLPLASLPLLEPEDYPYLSGVDPSERRDALPERIAATKVSGEAEQPARTALTVELRDGKLCVFLPPVARLEHSLELLGAVEAAAGEIDVAVRLEGFSPPHDPRLRMLTIAPDPGVIEVNVHPAATWREAVEIIAGVYEDARAIGLCAEKFHSDGRHAGTGGGDHVVFGAAHPEDSPFLRRPDLLKSMLIYWQRRPALSYFFSGQFVGPSSQAPRVDEARHESLYELEIALERIAPSAKIPAPWEIDRLLRNLLCDMSGNTHRAEFCIDKLFAPQGPMGRLGLLELRAFEMAPTAEMSLATRALLRALIAWLWRAPISGPLTRWGTALGDRFMLPAFLWADFNAVLADLREAGYAFQSAWFEPQRAFRFPMIGALKHGDVSITLRQALEPWHVLAEQHEDGGVSRPVDSSLERVEVAAEHFNPERYVISCNGRRLPMTKVALGTFAAGVRYKARKLALGLHPTLETHLPLRFELFDLWAGQTVAEFSYGLPVEEGERPRDAEEAAARRKARFASRAVTRPGQAPPTEANSEFPATLDLRRPVR